MKRRGSGNNSARKFRTWQPLQRAVPVPKTPAEITRLLAHFREVFPRYTEAEILAMVADVTKDELWKNDRYQVSVRRNPAGVVINGAEPIIVHLSIRRLDRAPARDWRDFQRIKNQLVGPECEGIELFPAESRLVDTANQFHIYCVADPEFRFPFGWDAGRHVDGRSGANAVQRPLEEASYAAPPHGRSPG